MKRRAHMSKIKCLGHVFISTALAAIALARVARADEPPPPAPAPIPAASGAAAPPPDATAVASASGIRARSAMDNAMFAVNYFTAIVGGGVAYVDHKLTVQLEATLFELMRVRGSNAGSSTDAARTNSTVGLHAGFFIIPM